MQAPLYTAGLRRLPQSRRGAVLSPAAKLRSCAVSRGQAAELSCLPRDLGGLVEGIELGEDLVPQVTGGDVTAAAAVQQ